ncbi:MAG: hypothetical protein ABIJ39_01275 [Chloroflexota bacterium]
MNSIAASPTRGPGSPRPPGWQLRVRSERRTGAGAGVAVAVPVSTGAALVGDALAGGGVCVSAAASPQAPRARPRQTTIRMGRLYLGCMGCLSPLGAIQPRDYNRRVSTACKNHPLTIRVGNLCYNPGQ